LIVTNSVAVVSEGKKSIDTAIAPTPLSPATTTTAATPATTTTTTRPTTASKEQQQILMKLPLNTEEEINNNSGSTSAPTMKMVPVCPGLVVKIRPTPSSAGNHVGSIKHNEEVEVFKIRENGFFKLVDGRVSSDNGVVLLV
jgi:hypothetical protein